MSRDKTKRSETPDESCQRNIRTSKPSRQQSKGKHKTLSRCCISREISGKMYRKKSNQINSEHDRFEREILKNKLIHQYDARTCVHKLSFEESSLTCSKVFILVTFFLVHNLSGVAGAGTAWVRQSMAPFNVEDRFHRFVEASGGNREKFSFDGNFFSSQEKSSTWDQPPHSSSFGKSLQSDTQNKPGPLEHDVVVSKSLQHDEEIRVPRTFYVDILDSSLPEDSPHQKSLRTSRLPRPPQQSLQSFGNKVHFSGPKKPYLYFGTRQPFSNDFSSNNVPQKTQRLKNFTFQSLGGKNFSSVAAPDKRIIPPNFAHNPPRQLSDRGSIKYNPKPRGMNNALGTELNGSSGFAQHKSSFPIFTSTFYQKPGGVEPAMGTLSLGFPSSRGKKEHVGSSTSKMANAAASISRSSENTAKNGSPTGCVDEDGIFRRQEERWFGRNCTRHTCVVFRTRHFIETDSCESELRNTSYRCFVVANEKARYPHCCPTYKCHPDILGRPNER